MQQLAKRNTHTPVCHEGSSGDEARSRATKEQYRVGNLLRDTQPAHGNSRRHVVLESWNIPPKLFRHVGLNPRGANAIDSDIIFDAIKCYEMGKQFIQSGTTLY